MPISTTIYGSVSDANTYFSTRLYEDWSGQPEAKQFAALLSATRSIELLDGRGLLYGTKADPDQELAFPRDGQDEVPEEVLIAVYEEAAERLRGRDPSIELEQIQVTSENAGGRVASYDRQNKPLVNLLYGFCSVVAWQNLCQFIAPNQSFTIERT